MLALLLVAACLVAIAQEKQDAKPATTQKKSMASGKEKPMAMPMMKQTAEMAKIQKLFAGTWKISATIEPMPEVGMMQQATSKGTQTSKMGPGGNSMIDEMKSTGATGTITGHGVVWYDPTVEGYQAVWCDNQTPMGCGMNGVGKFVGDDLIFEGDIKMPPEMGGNMHMKETYSDIKPDSFTFSIEGGPNAIQMKHMMTIKYVRAMGTASTTAKTK
ncbi:MAG TPA: DUF1579 family protein [Terriglobales bacterium]|nr:DUF1579 family protein [Terriglobales bacterium]